MIASEVIERIKGCTLLIVEDEPEILELLGSSFESAECKVHLAQNGADAIQILEQNSVDVLITDARMPVLSGAELVERLDRRGLTPPVLIITSGCSDEGEDFFFLRGAYAFFEKPVATQNIASSIADALKARNIQGRKHPRKRIAAMAEVSRGALNSNLEGAALNLSRGGVFILSRGELPKIGEEVQVAVAVDSRSNTAIRGTAVCRWWRESTTLGLPPGIGLEFQNLTPESQALLENLP